MPYIGITKKGLARERRRMAVAMANMRAWDEHKVRVAAIWANYERELVQLFAAFEANAAAERARTAAANARAAADAERPAPSPMWSMPQQAGIQIHPDGPAGSIWYASIFPDDPLTKRTALVVVRRMVPGQQYEMSVYNYRRDAFGELTITRDYKISFRGKKHTAESTFTRRVAGGGGAEPNEKRFWLEDDAMADVFMQINDWQFNAPYPHAAIEFELRPIVVMNPAERAAARARQRAREDKVDDCQCVPNLIESALGGAQRKADDKLRNARIGALRVLRAAAVANNGCRDIDYDLFEKQSRGVRIIVFDASGTLLWKSHRKSGNCVMIKIVHHNNHAFTVLPAFPAEYTSHELYERAPLPPQGADVQVQADAIRVRDSTLWAKIASEKSERMWLIGGSCYVTGGGKLVMPRDIFDALCRAAAVNVGLNPTDMYNAKLSAELVTKRDAEIAFARKHTTVRAYEFKRWIGEMNITPTKEAHKKIMRACCIEQRVWSCKVTRASAAAAPFLLPLDVRACYVSFVKPSNVAAYPYYKEFGFMARDDGSVYSFNRLVTAADIRFAGATELVQWTFAADTHPYVRGLIMDHLTANQWILNPLLAFLLREKVLVSCFARSTLVSTSKHTGITFPRDDKNLGRELLGCLTPNSIGTTSIVIQDPDEAKILEESYRESAMWGGIEQHPSNGCSVIRIKLPDSDHRATWIHARASHLAYAHITVLHALLRLTRKYGNDSIHHIRTDSIHLDIGKRVPFAFPPEKPGGPGSWRVKGTAAFHRLSDSEQFGYETPLSWFITLAPSDAMPVSSNEIQFHQLVLCTGQGGNGKTTAALLLYPNAMVLCDTNLLVSDYRYKRGVKRCSTYHKFFHYNSAKAPLASWTPAALGDDWVCPTHVIWDEICSVTVAELKVFLPFLESRGCVVVMCGDPGQTTAFAENIPGGVAGYLKARPDVFKQHLTTDYRAKTTELKAIKLAMHEKAQNVQLAVMRKSFPTTDLSALDREWQPTDYVIVSTNVVRKTIIARLAAVHEKRFGSKLPHRLMYSPGLNDKKRISQCAKAKVEYKVPPPKGSKFGTWDPVGKVWKYSSDPIRVCNGTMVYVDKRPHESQLGEGFGWRSGACMTIHGVKGQTVYGPAKLWIIDDSMTFDENMPYTAVSRCESHLQIRRVELAKRPPIVEGSIDAKKAKIASKIAAHLERDARENQVPARPITVDSVIALGDVCYSCGSTVYFTGYPPYDDRQFSVDRIDNTQGHGIGNCRMSCFGCNRTHQGQGLRPSPAGITKVQPAAVGWVMTAAKTRWEKPVRPAATLADLFD